MKIFEYMAMGKPVIAPSGNSITESLVIPQTTGMLFEAGNPCSLAETIITFAAKPEIVKELGTKAKEFVVGNFTWYDQTRDLFKAFEAAIANFKSQGVKSGISINKYHAGF
jgi:glycosyltransferase involved in cell wall biosynthesis